MVAYIIRRIFQAIIVLIIVTMMIFFAMRLLPGDPILMLVTSQELEEATEEQIAKLRHEFGLDRPMIVQYVDWLGGVLRGDFGTSILNRSPVTDEIVRRIPISFNIAIISWIISHALGLIFGILCGIRRGTHLDTALTFLANIGITVPGFWLGVLGIYLFALYLRWLPVMGYTPPFEDFVLHVRQMIMPVFVLSLGGIAGTTRQTRSCMLEVMRQDYIRTAWSKGLKEQTIIIRHALKNGLIPVVTLSGMSLAGLLGGSVLIETVFNIPGMGRLAVTSVMNQDYPYTQAITLIMCAAIILANLLVDVLYGWMDPRIRYS